MSNIVFVINIVIIMMTLIYFVETDLEKAKECLNNDVCVQYYRKYKNFDMQSNSFRIYSENIKEENEN